MNKATPDLTLKEIKMVEKLPFSEKRGFPGDTTFTADYGNLEKRYCSDCYVDQPIRTKHCQPCGICVATFDHHCFWVGNCIGEKNRPVFLVYLFIQVAEMLTLIGKPWLSIHQAGYLATATSSPLLLITVIIYLGLLIGLLSLMVYHLYFMATNLTTWEYLSWEKITYLEGYEQKDGSPFSVSLLANGCIYMRPYASAFYDWVPNRPRK